ncbi:MAG: glycosyltransferase family 2 protein [Armatimonadetes bacterium]|nr:glycosyltransferase family 2 protein [Armatimonadota bacterium]
MDLSVLIVNWNTAALLRGCLRSLRGALVPMKSGSAEVIVVDNASADGSADLVRREFPEVRLIANQVNRNYAVGSNQGLAIAQGDLILLLNPDTEVSATALARLRQFLMVPISSGAGGVAPRLVYPTGETQASVRGFPTPTALFGEVTGFGRLFPRSRWGGYRRSPALDRPMPVDQPMASCLLLRRAALAEIGGFDEGLPLFWNDVDLCLRLHAAGWEIWYLPEAVVIHYGGASTRQVRARAIWASHRGLHRLLSKHYRRRMPGPLYAISVAAIYAAGAVRVALAWLRARVPFRSRKLSGRPAAARPLPGEENQW